jgi:hypothetical protein
MGTKEIIREIKKLPYTERLVVVEQTMKSISEDNLDSLEKATDLKRIFEVIDAGVDISSFGDVKEWQRITRADRNINRNGI